MKHKKMFWEAGNTNAEALTDHFLRPRVSFYTKYGKRLFDVVFALILLPVLAPLMLVIAAGMAHKGKIIFKQVRVGKGGKLFVIYKFRTMRIDAEAYLEKLRSTNPDLAREWAVNQSLDPDPRITKVGLFLRQTKLDELPQLANIILGDMSFVGPRPFLQTQKCIYDNISYAANYYKVRPGITGLWQIDQKRDRRFDLRPEYDGKYISQCSFLKDLRIILVTMLVPFQRIERQFYFD